MAKVNAPFLSLSASGTVAGTLTASRWKGIKTMRQKSEPANPKTAKQQAQRGKMRNSVSFWRFVIVDALMKLGWNTSASLSGKPQSGFNIFTSLAIKAQKLDANAATAKAYNVTSTAHNATAFSIVMATITNGGEAVFGTNAGVLKYGASPDQLINSVPLEGSGDAEINATDVDTGLAAGDTLYFQASTEIGGQTIPCTGILSVVLT